MFKYEIVRSIHKIEYRKITLEGCVTFSSDIDSKYVDFKLGEKTKKFKKGDLFLAVLDQTPIAWEIEKDVKL